MPADADDSSYDANLGPSFREYQPLFDVQLEVRRHGIPGSNGFAQPVSTTAHTLDCGRECDMGRQAPRQIRCRQYAGPTTTAYARNTKITGLFRQKIDNFKRMHKRDFLLPDRLRGFKGREQPEHAIEAAACRHRI
jgi:hypothetical protein